MHSHSWEGYTHAVEKHADTQLRSMRTMHSDPLCASDFEAQVAHAKQEREDIETVLEETVRVTAGAD